MNGFNSINILGVKFSNLGLIETIELIGSKISENCSKTFHLITANPEITVQIQDDKEYGEIAVKADIITPDGIGIVIASKLKGKPLKERVTGFDLLVQSLKKGNEKGWSFYILGSEEEVNEKATDFIRKVYNGIKLVGRHNGYFNCEKEQTIIKEIQQTKPDILIVAMGSPLSDKWINRNRDKLDGNVKIVYGVGGSLDVLSGKVKRAPKIWIKLNLEWLYRRITQPSRKDRQKKLCIFVCRVIIETLIKRKTKG